MDGNVTPRGQSFPRKVPIHISRVHVISVLLWTGCLYFYRFTPVAKVYVRSFTTHRVSISPSSLSLHASLNVSLNNQIGHWLSGCGLWKNTSQNPKVFVHIKKWHWIKKSIRIHSEGSGRNAYAAITTPKGNVLLSSHTELCQCLAATSKNNVLFFIWATFHINVNHYILMNPIFPGFRKTFGQ